MMTFNFTATEQNFVNSMIDNYKGEEMVYNTYCKVFEYKFTSKQKMKDFVLLFQSLKNKNFIIGSESQFITKQIKLYTADKPEINDIIFNQSLNEKELKMIEKFNFSNFIGRKTIYAGNGQKVECLSFKINIPKRHDFRATFSNTLATLIKRDIVIKSENNFNGSMTIFIKNTKANCERTNIAFKEPIEKIKLTDKEKFFYTELITSNKNEISDYGKEFWYKENELLSVYQIGALISTLTEKGLIKVIDKKSKLVKIQKFI